jgi:hypothetical protein
MILSDGTKYSCGESVGTLIAPDVAGINGTLVGFSLPADRLSSATEGKSWNLDSFIIADGTGTFSAGAYLPASYTSEGTLYSGSAKQLLDVDAASVGAFDGSTYADAAVLTHSSTAGAIEVRFSKGSGASTEVGFSLGSSGRCFLGVSSSGKLSYGLGNDGLGTVNDPNTWSSGEWITGRLEWNGSTVTLKRDGAIVGSDTQSGSVVFNDTVIGANANKILSVAWSGGISWVKVYDGSGTLLNHFVVQASSTSTQTTIYDIGPSANHATLTGATLPDFWQGTADESHLGQWGGSTGLTDNVELVTNPTVMEDITILGANIGDVDNDILQVTYIDNDDGYRLFFSVAGIGNNLTVGDRYRFTAEYKVNIGSSVTPQVYDGTTAYHGSTIVTSTEYVEVSVDFTALHASACQSNMQNTFGAGEIVWIKNPSIQRVETGIIPGKENSTLDAVGNTKTFDDYKDSNLPASCVNVTLPETLEMYEAAPGLFTAGVPDATDSSTISDGDEDDIRKSDVAMLVTDGAQTGACKDQTDGYLGV